MHRTLCILAAAACLGLAATSHAQPADDDARLIDVRYDGGTLPEFIQTLRAASAPAPVNVLLPDELSRHELPPIELQSVTVSTAMRMIETLPIHGAASYRVSVLHDPEQTVGAEPVYSISVRSMSQGARMSPSTAVFMIRDLVESDGAGPALTTSDLLTALDVSVNAVPATGARAQMHFHEDTGVLVVTGPGEALSTASSLLESLREDLNMRRARSMALLEESHRQAERAATLELRLDATMQQLREAEATAKDLAVAKERDGLSELGEQRLMMLRQRFAQLSEEAAVMELELAIQRQRHLDTEREPRQYRFRAAKDSVLQMLDALKALQPHIEVRSNDPSGESLEIVAGTSEHALLEMIQRMTESPPAGRSPRGGGRGR